MKRIRIVDDARHKLLPAIEVGERIFALLVKSIERQVVCRKRRRTLASVRSARQCVVALELQSSGQSTISLEHERVILRNHIAANLRDLRETRVRARSDENRRQVSLAVEWATNDIQRHDSTWRRKVRIDEVGQRVAVAAEIRRRDHRVSRNLSFENEVPLMNLRELEIFGEVLDRTDRRVRCRQ